MIDSLELMERELKRQDEENAKYTTAYKYRGEIYETFEEANFELLMYQKENDEDWYDEYIEEVEVLKDYLQD